MQQIIPTNDLVFMATRQPDGIFKVSPDNIMYPDERSYLSEEVGNPDEAVIPVKIRWGKVKDGRLFRARVLPLTDPPTYNDDFGWILAEELT